jgi:hypothetical protein
LAYSRPSRREDAQRGRRRNQCRSPAHDRTAHQHAVDATGLIIFYAVAIVILIKLAGTGGGMQ